MAVWMSRHYASEKPAPYAQGGAASDAQNEAQNDAQGKAENGPQAPRADLAARITPWAAQPVAQAQARYYLCFQSNF